MPNIPDVLTIKVLETRAIIGERAAFADLKMYQKTLAVPMDDNEKDLLHQINRALQLATREGKAPAAPHSTEPLPEDY